MLALPLAALLLPSTAHALKPAKHRQLAEASCHQAGLPDGFCRRMGKAVYETDYKEWDDLSAHAQTARGQDRCTAADAAITRAGALGTSISDAITRRDLETAAIDLGRALHTIQDECAHHGMTNEQHAYLSLEQTCGSEDVSPDIQPEAIACAAQRTATVMNIVKARLAVFGDGDAAFLCVDRFSEQNQDSCNSAALPTPVQACNFLALFTKWDHTDTTWNSPAVGSALLESFSAAYRGSPVTLSACAGDAHAIDPSAPALGGNGRVSCALIDVGCLGKVDGDSDVDPYGEDGGDTASGGCSTGSNSSGWLVVGVLALVLRRRRVS